MMWIRDGGGITAKAMTWMGMEEGLTAKAMAWTTHCAMESGEFYCSFSKKKKGEAGEVGRI